MIPHKYINASDNAGAYAADLCNRQAVTVEYAFTKIAPDTVAWMYRRERDDAGMDPWTEITGLDKSTTDDSYFVDYCRYSTLKVPADFPLYVQRSDLKKQGLPTGESGGPKN